MTDKHQPHTATCGTCRRFRPNTRGSKYGTCTESSELLNTQRAGCYAHLPRVAKTLPKRAGKQMEMEV